jgi:cytochrome c oxidase cbb3-type subunit 1
MAAVGTMLWLMCRLSRTPLRYPALPVLSCLVWNVGVLVGAWELLFGRSNGIEWLEFPSHAALIIFIAFGLNVVWTAITFGSREEPHVYVSQWYILGAIFWFPWLYATTNILLMALPANLVATAPVRGVTQASINWWYGHNALGVWYTPIGLAAIYYLLPKVLGRPIHSYYLSILGFWTFALFYNWAGAHHLISGPVPAWLITVSVVASMMMIIPVATVAINHHRTMRGYFDILRFSPTLRFITTGAMCYTLVSLQGSFMSLRSINEPTHFTHYTIAHAHLGLYAFFTMVMFGAIYYIVPRLTGREWASSHLIRVHFWGSFLGVLMMFVVLSVGGLIQGFELNQASESWHELTSDRGLWEGTRHFLFGSVDPQTGEMIGGFRRQNGAVPFLTVMKGTLPWLRLRSVSGILMLVGHVAFAILLLLNLVGSKWTRRGPALLKDDQARYAELVREKNV